MSQEYVVVWSGRDSLLPDRAERLDTRFSTMQSYDIDEDDARGEKPVRQYNKTGKYKGVFSRTNPLATQFKPTTTKCSVGGR